MDTIRISPRPYGSRNIPLAQNCSFLNEILQPESAAVYLKS